MNSINLIPTVRDILGGGNSDVKDDKDVEVNDICYLEKFGNYYVGDTAIFYYKPGIYKCEYNLQTYLKEKMRTGKGSVDISASGPSSGSPSDPVSLPASGSSSDAASDTASVPASDTASDTARGPDSDDASVIISNGNIPVRFSNYQPIEKLMCNYTFFEKQENLGCGRHALNNLLGGKYFINEYDPKIDINNIEELPGNQPIALQTICRYLKKLYSLMDYCPDSEYYDINILMFALALYGFVLNDSNQYDRRHPVLENRKLDKYFDTVDEKNLIGFIIHFPGHWACVRKESSNYRYFDSLGMYHKTTYTKENLVSLLLGTYMDYMCQVHYNGIIIDRTEIFKAFVS